MSSRLLEAETGVLPAPRWAVAAWLIAPAKSIGPAGDAELRQTMLRRLDASLFSAAVTFIIIILAFSRHRTLPMGAWLFLDIVLAAVRVPVLVCMLRSSRHARPGRAMPLWITDAYVCSGTLWSALLGFGTLFCLSTNDPGLSVIAALLAMGTIGAQASRSPGSPRLNTVQMCAIILPFTLGAFFSKFPLMDWILALLPMYLAAMISITRQLHEDYAALLVSRIENQRRSLRCSLTGLPNRLCFDESLQATVKTRLMGGRPLLVMCLDLDGFKSINDRFGHPAGDALLVEVARRLQIWAESKSFVARMGGDEFAILLATDDCRQAEIDAQTLIDSLGRPYDLGLRGDARIGASIGLASSAPDMEPATLMLQADTALYEAKRAGKGRFRWHIDPTVVWIGAGELSADRPMPRKALRA
jgi:diguanylate cyclase (GGDEF)-like protein